VILWEEGHVPRSDLWIFAVMYDALGDGVECLEEYAYVRRQLLISEIPR
jgi:hypothetical protein